MTQSLTDQVALVTGASGGIGRRFARALADAGATVVATARRKDKLDELTAEIEAAGGRCVPRALDLTDPDQIRAVVEDVSTAVGLVRVLVNNAGIVDARRAHKMPPELVDAVIGTNLRAPWQLATDVAARLIAAKQGGRIVNISSIAASHYGPDSAPASLYAVTKSALNRMTEVLAVEWARYGINVNGIEPGAVHTEMMDGLFHRTGVSAEDFAARLTRGRMLTPDHLVGTLLYLVGPASEGVTGTVITVDDGQTPR